MDLRPDFTLEKDKTGSLPQSLNCGVIINLLPFPIGIEVNHDKFQHPTITLLPVEGKV